MATSKRCQRALEQPPPCGDFREVRRWVLCDAWRRVAEEQIPFREAIRRSWDQALDQCRGGGEEEG